MKTEPMIKKYNFGFWEVAGKQYDNKLKAVVDAVPQGWWPHYNFFEEQFSQYNWTLEPTQSLSELYQERARKLRSKYSFIAIEYSGGADSWNVLYSFIKQGLKVDLVIHKVAEAAIKGRENDKSIENSAAESYYQAYPWYKKFLELDPTLKWHTYNTTDEIINGWSTSSLDPFEVNSLHIGHMNKVPGIVTDGYSFIPNNATILYGIDKPNLVVKDSKFYLYFPDHSVTCRAFAERERLGLPTTDIMFYHDPDCFNLIAKQAHIVMNWFRKHPELLWLLETERPKGVDDGVLKSYRRLIISLIYPDYQEYWQPDKSSGFNKFEYDWWFHSSGPESKHVQNWQASMTKQSDIIAQTLTGTQFEKFIKTEQDYNVLPICWSKWYYLGDL